jgi:cobalt-zinc-cadmium efflux system outer membrane protein
MAKTMVVFIVSLIFFLASGGSAGAQLTLESAVARALERNPEILRAKQELESASARSLQARAIPNPELVFSQEGISAGNAAGEQEISLGIEQIIEFPGKRGRRIDTAKMEEQVYAAELVRLRTIVTTRVKEAFFRGVYAQAMIRSSEELLGFLKQYQDMAAVRVQSGQVSSLDVLRGRLEGLRIQNELVELRRLHQESLLSLYLEMGGEQAGDESLTAEFDFEPLGTELDSLKMQAESGVSLRAAALRLEHAEAGVLLARKNILPDFRLGFYYPSLRSSAWGFSIGASIPLWQQQYRGEVLEAEARIQEMSIALESKRRKVLSEVERLFSEVRAAEDQIVLFKKSVLPEIESMLELGMANYAYGKIDSLNLFDFYRLFKTTHQEYLTALLNHKIALVRLAAAGDMD